ncbi:MAG: L-threonylcarbamoyladenylate synthase [Chitinophagaceae bacterium]
MQQNKEHTFNTEVNTDIQKAVTLLCNDEIVAIPTETVYGLAGNALSPNAITKIYTAKKRPFFNPLILHTYHIDAITEFAFVNEAALQLMQHFMPGPFTILLTKKDIVPDLLTAGSYKVAIRIPAHEITQSLLTQLPFPLAAPSANPFGYISPVTASHVYEHLKGEIPYVLDGGACSVGVESTIVEVTTEQIIIHRLGGIGKEAIEAVATLPVVLQQKHAPIATSGQLKSHYAPSTPLLMGDVATLIHQHIGKKIAVISFYETYSGVDNYALSTSKSLAMAASNLFATLHKIDAKDYDVIVAEKFPEEGIGAAINDRLERAQFIHK